MIFFEKVTKLYNNNIKALDNADIEIKQKEFVTIAGPSGAGKSTIFKLITGEEKPTSGKIFFQDKEISALKNKNLAETRKKIGVIYQDFKLIKNKTVYENIAVMLEIIGKSDKEIQKDVPQVLDLVGLSDRANHFPKQLSGGEQQRTAIARAVVQRPDIILADEPAGNLDPTNSFEIIQLLIKINELGTTVVLASHDKTIINSLEKRVISIEKGIIIKNEEKGKYIF